MFVIIRKIILWHLFFEEYRFQMLAAATSQMVHPLSPIFDDRRILHAFNLRFRRKMRQVVPYVSPSCCERLSTVFVYTLSWSIQSNIIQ